MSMTYSPTFTFPDERALVSMSQTTALVSPHRDPFNICEEDPLVLRHLQKVIVDDVEYLQMSDFFAGWIWFHLVDLADRIKAASHGHLPGTSLGPVPTTLLDGACQALGLEELRLFEFLRNVQDHNPIQGRWPADVWRKAWDSVQRVGRETVSWFSRARLRTQQMNGGVRWLFDEHDLRVRVQWLALQGSTALVVHPVYGTDADAALIPYRPESPYFDMGNSCRDVIPHPIYGSGANSALATTPSHSVATLLSELNPCRAIMLHPVWSSSADHQVVPYYQGDVATPMSPPDSPITEDSEEDAVMRNASAINDENMNEDE
ncbi:hypothetical protein TRAPUB_14037 [Trametes pubescens]|uniref:Uncharacterized protein n=1 Tax=Trametes pubescens TaxID=154538 RepID=A0A1M2VPH2_TRAPU|nr:hypothetical protein TRAPUB_14037 [Trametes pubescens]